MGSLFSDIGNAIGYASSGAERGRESRAAGQVVDNANSLNAQVNADPAANAYANIHTNPAYMQAAGEALNQLGAVGRGTGLTPQAASALQAAQLSNAQQQGAAVQAQLANAARSGTINSGRAISGLVGADQGATNANAMAGANAASNSEAQRLNALNSVGQLGANLSNTQFGQQAQIAQGTNQANQFNSAQNVQAQQLSNQDALAKEQAQAAAEQNIIGLNQQQAKGIQGLGSELGDAAGQIASTATTGGFSQLGNLFGGGGGTAQYNGPTAGLS